jgi:hypothetical protein
MGGGDRGLEPTTRPLPALCWPTAPGLPQEATCYGRIVALSVETAEAIPQSQHPGTMSHVKHCPFVPPVADSLYDFANE